MSPADFGNGGRGVMSAVLAEVYMEEGVVGLEPRVARIEADVANLKETVTRLEEKVDERFDKVDERFDKVDERFDKVDERFERIDERFGRIDAKLNQLDQGMTVMESRFEGLTKIQTSLDTDLRELRKSLDSKFLWIVTTMIAFGSALLAAMAKGFHWFG